MRQKGVFLPAGLLLLAALACGLPDTLRPAATLAGPPTARPVTATPALVPTQRPPAPTPTPAPTRPPPALDQIPLYWFGPLPPMPTHPGRPYTGSDDFLDLFAPGAPWDAAASHLQVFKLYGEWVAYHATDAQLRLAIEGIAQRGLALAVEAGPLDPPPECGEGVESFAGIDEGLLIARRIKAAGGTLHLIALDEPYFYAHFYDGPNACHWDAERIARGVDAYIQAMRLEFPQAIIGDTEPLAGAAGAPEYQGWLDTFRAAAGYDLPFLHMDVDWGRPAWAEEVRAIETYGRERGTAVGIIYTGFHDAASDADWIQAAGERVRDYEQKTGGRPDHVLFQSWNDHPDFVLPDDQPNTFTHLIRAYFEDPASLGYPRAGPGANLALDRPVTASAWGAGFEPGLAVDGNPGTWWGANAGPPQWIQIDLGAAHAIREIRLNPSQYPAGPTAHRVLGRGPATGGAFVLLHLFEGETEDLRVLSFAPPEPWAGIESVRVETIASPSWVAWREIEVVAAE